CVCYLYAGGVYYPEIHKNARIGILENNQLVFEKALPGQFVVSVGIRHDLYIRKLVIEVCIYVLLMSFDQFLQMLHDLFPVRGLEIVADETRYQSQRCK